MIRIESGEYKKRKLIDLLKDINGVSGMNLTVSALQMEKLSVITQRIMKSNSLCPVNVVFTRRNSMVRIKTWASVLFQTQELSRMQTIGLG